MQFPGHVNAAFAAAHPVFHVSAHIIGKLGASIAAFTGIIPAGPDKIAHDLRVFLRDLPEVIGVPDQGLRSQDQAVLVFLRVAFIAPDPVIVAGDVHGGVSIPRFPVAGFQCRAELHKIRADLRRDHVKELRTDRLFFRLLFRSVLRRHRRGPGVLFGLFVTVNAHAHGA